MSHRAQLARMYELKREKRALAGEVADVARTEERLTLRLDSLKAEVRDGERYIATIDSITESTRAERQRLEARLRALESLSVYRDDVSRDTVSHDTVSYDAVSHGDVSRDDISYAAPGSTVVRQPLAVAHRSHKHPLVFYGGLTAGVVAVRTFHLDSDPGGYHDGVRTKSLFPDKAVHALAAWVITGFGSDLKIGAWKSAAAVCVTGVGFEFAQGYVSGYDIGANCLGAAGAALWRSWLGR